MLRSSQVSVPATGETCGRSSGNAGTASGVAPAATASSAAIDPAALAEGVPDAVDELAERHGRRPLATGVLVGPGIGDHEVVGRREHGVEQQRAVAHRQQPHRQARPDAEVNGATGSPAATNAVRTAPAMATAPAALASAAAPLATA